MAVPPAAATVSPLWRLAAIVAGVALVATLGLGGARLADSRHRAADLQAELIELRGLLGAGDGA